MNNNENVILNNTLRLICFTVLAVVFNKWWLICCFWIREAVRDFTEKKWGPLFFIDVMMATAFAGLLLRTIFMS